MMTETQYRTNERAKLARRIADIAAAPLRDRQMARIDFGRLLNEPEHLRETIEWIFAGNYGVAEMWLAREIMAQTRSNRIAALSQLAAALECQCPPNFARDAWLELPTGAQTAANDAIARAMDSAPVAND